MRTFNPGFTCHPPLFVGWNNNDKSSNIALSAGLLTATAISSGDGAVRATLIRASGKYYCEIALSAITGGDTGAGLANASAVLANLGAVASGGMVQFKGGNLYKNGSVLFNNGAISAGDILRVAYDADGHLGWLAKGAGNWNGNAAFSPDAGTGGQDMTAFDSGGLFPVWLTGANGDVGVLNAGASSFTYSLPTAFSAWNTG